MMFFYIVSRLFGITFGIKLLERGETDAAEKYTLLKEDYPQVAEIVKDEEVHEEKLIAMINEEKLNYVGSIVLGLNDALVELTGALAGFTFAFQDTRLIAVTGLITGISASFSMAASEYLSTVPRDGRAQHGAQIRHVYGHSICADRRGPGAPLPAFGKSFCKPGHNTCGRRAYNTGF